MYLLVNSSPKPLAIATSNFAGAQNTLHCIVGPGPQGQGHMYFLINKFPKPLDVATANFAGA